MNLSLNSIRRVSGYYIFVTLILAAAGNGRADEYTPDEELPPIAEQEHVTIVEMDQVERIITKTGTKLGGFDLFHSPMHLTIITRQQLQYSGARNLSEALEIFVPGFQYMINKWDGYVWGLRGVASEINDKFIFLVNGIKQNLQSRDGANFAVMLGCLEDIDRIEVLSGPAGLTYGSGAIAGVVNLVTRRTGNATSESTVQLGTMGFNAKDIQLDKQVFLELSKVSSLALSVGYYVSRGIGEDRGRLYGYPSYSYPDIKDTIPYYPRGGLPVNGSAGKTPGNWRAALDYGYKNFRLYSRYTRQVQQASGYFIYDPWPEITDHSIITDTVVEIDGKVIHKPPGPALDSTSAWKFWTSTEGSGFNRWMYRADNLLVSAAQDIPVGEDLLKINADVTSAADNILLEQLDDYFDPSEEKVNEIFGETRFGTEVTYLLRRVRNFYGALGAEVCLDNIGNDPFHQKNSHRGMDLVNVIEPVIFTNLSAYGEAYYDILGREKVAFHFGGRLDLRYNNSDPLNASAQFAHAWQRDFSPKLSLIITPNRRNVFKIIYHKSSNFGSADIYQRNFYFTKSDGTAYDADHFETPEVRPTSSTDILLSWKFVRDSVLGTIRKEETRSVELSTLHRFRDEQLFLGTSLSYNKYNNLLLWCQDIFRRINMNPFQVLSGILDVGYHGKEKNIVIGVNHSMQYLLNADPDKGTLFKNHYYDTTLNKPFFLTKVVNGDTTYIPNPEIMRTIEDTIFGVRSQITTDGIHLLNMSSNVTKLYLDVNPSPRWGFHIDARIFWAALKGRKSIHESDAVNNVKPEWAGTHEYFDLDRAPLLKLNAGIHIKLFENRSFSPQKTIFKMVAFSLFAYDLLGIDYYGSSFLQRNTIRWQQMSFEKDRDLYSVDLASFVLKMNIDF